MKSQVNRKELIAHRKRMFQLFDLVPETGCYVPYLGLKLKVYPTVFWPHEDSYALANNYRINQGETVLDVCSGSGNLAILSALKGAKRVIGLEHNPLAVKAAQENVNAYNLADRVKIRESNMFDELKENERFDVITGNLPFTDRLAKNQTESSMHDTNLEAHKLFFAGLDLRLNKSGRAYLAHSDIGAMNMMFNLADEVGFSVSQIGEYVQQKPHIVFSAFELRRKQ